MADKLFFGWKMTAQSTAESYCNNVAVLGIIIGLTLVVGAVAQTANEERSLKKKELAKLPPRLSTRIQNSLKRLAGL